VSVTIIIICITAAVSIAAFSNIKLFDQLKLFPAIMTSNKEAHRIATYGLIHADWMHMLINMYVLYSFGARNGTEFMYNGVFGAKGTLFYVLLYVGGLVTSVIPSYEKNKTNFGYTAVGASGAVSSIVFAYILFNPLNEFYFLFIPFAIPAYIFGAFYLGISYYLAKQNQGNIGHDSHFFGALFGIMFTILLDKNIAINFVEILKAHWS
jgi:membrane associated rhomboid family serine protease